MSWPPGPAHDANGMPHALEIKAGGQVRFGKWPANEIKHDGEDLEAIKKSVIVSVVERAATKNNTT